MDLYSKASPQNFFIVLGALTAVTLVAGPILLKYLQGSKVEESSSRRMYERFERLQYRLTELQASIENVSHNVFTAEEKERIATRAIEHIKELDNDASISKIFTEMEAKKEKDKSEVQLDELVQQLSGTLELEIKNLGRRANVNLLIGILITISGLLILLYYVSAINFSSELFNDKFAVAIYFISRFTLVAFIEVFAFFFLRLYRYSLFEIKYFQNELTNTRFKVISLRAASQFGEQSIINKICLDFAKTERNFILKKGDTTISLRQAEIEDVNDRRILEVVRFALRQVDSSRDV